MQDHCGLYCQPFYCGQGNLFKINLSYHCPMCHGLIFQKKTVLIIKEPMKHECAYRSLQVVLGPLWSIFVVAFAANLISGQPRITKTIVHICLFFFWSGL
jgi:hypothetical protein